MKVFNGKNIYETIEEMADPSHTALILWDLQNGLVNNIYNKEEFVENIKNLIKAARSHNMKIIYTKITPLPFEYMPSTSIYFLMKLFHSDDP